MIDTKCGTKVSLETNLSFVCRFFVVYVLKVHLSNIRNYTVEFKNNFYVSGQVKLHSIVFTKSLHT